MGFFDNLLKKDDETKSKSGNGGGGLRNPFQPRAPTFGGQGQSLGGSQPGIVIPISLPNPGPVGVQVSEVK